MNSLTIEEELQKNSQLNKEDIQSLRIWCDTQYQLPKVWENDLALFLHANYYCIEDAKQHIDNYYTVRTHVNEFFANRDPITSEKLRKAFDTVSVVPLQKQTKEGYRVIIARLIDTDPSNYDYDSAIKYFNMVLDLCIYEQGTNDGYIFIFDINGASMKHTASLSWMGLKKFFYYIQNCAPIRWKGLHYINTSSVIDKIQEFVKLRIVNNHFADKIYFHSNLENFNKIVPLEILPNELGGSAGPLMDMHKEQIKKLESHHNWFNEMELRSKVDENQRCGKSLTTLDIFGAERNFKQLDFD